MAWFSETQAQHLDTNYLWIQEKAVGGDLNFQRVAGTDNAADLFKKTLTGNEIQSHIHKLNSQLVQDEVSVNYVGARPNGVHFPQVLRDMGLAWQKSGSDSWVLEQSAQL